MTCNFLVTRRSLKDGIRLLTIVLAVLLVVSPLAAVADDFPFDQELFLDAKPLPGSKRVPSIEIAANGEVKIDFWCKSGGAHAEVTGDAVKFMFDELHEKDCTPERAQLDDNLVMTLLQTTQWRQDEDAIVFSGAADVRFYLSTH
jgi:hypothetical protein